MEFYESPGALKLVGGWVISRRPKCVWGTPCERSTTEYHRAASVVNREAGRPQDDLPILPYYVLPAIPRGLQENFEERSAQPTLCD